MIYELLIRSILLFIEVYGVLFSGYIMFKLMTR